MKLIYMFGILFLDVIYSSSYSKVLCMSSVSFVSSCYTPSNCECRDKMFTITSTVQDLHFEFLYLGHVSFCSKGRFANKC